MYNTNKNAWREKIQGQEGESFVKDKDLGGSEREIETRDEF